ncbi:ATP-dependent Clp protease ATP-binding subunit [Patescibacteria group bacterium]|nr:ATP-dependent Clp protease ATP-binding subunit [Patescibacteria group bacterium]MCL5010064.1 ATP-dependent Clp protease ATP-binding subunit [Patescibacteria group bacterium]
MKDYARIYHIYKTPLVRFLRLIVFLALLFFVFKDSQVSLARRPLFLLSLLSIWEIFFLFKISRLSPKITVSDGKSDIYESFSLEALAIFETVKSLKTIIKRVVNQRNIEFMLRKTNIKKNEITLIEADKEEIAKKAMDLAKNSNGSFITTADIFAAYILYTEAQTKLLFSKGIKDTEFMHILYWTRTKFTQEEQRKPIRIRFLGKGAGEDWVYGWTLETKKYTADLTKQTLKQEPVLIGRDLQYKEVLEALLNKEKGNFLLVGNPGAGKTTIIKHLAFESFTGNITAPLVHKRFLELMAGVLLAGIANQGELEKRLTNILEEIAHAGNVVLYIQKLEDILGSSSLNLDLSSAIFPYLESGKINIVATSTPSNYKTYIEPKGDFVQFFNIIKLQEPDIDSAILMVMEKASLIEKAYKLSITYKAVSSAVTYARRYLADKSLPGSAIALLNETAGSAKFARKKIINEEDIVSKVEEITHVQIALPKEEEKDLLLHFEEKMHEKIVDQNEAISSIAGALRRLRSGIGGDRPISFLFLGPTGVGKTETAKTLANLYFRGETNMIRIDMSEYKTQDSIKRMIGSAEQDGELTRAIYEHPFSLVLLDEFEKAHPDILDLFLQVLDDGRLTNAHGKTVSFRNSIIIATSNAGSELIREELAKSPQDTFSRQLLDRLQIKEIFKPELLNRFDSIVVFKPLGQKEIFQITGLLLAKVTQRLKEEDINLSFDEKVKAKIAKEGFNEEFGARPLRRFIQNSIENVLAQKMLSSEILRGNNVLVSTDSAGNITFSVF